MDLNGQWTGIAIYGSMYRKHKFKKLHFEMDIIQEQDAVGGISIDRAGTGVNPDPARISGSYLEGNLRFIKQYPTLHYYDRGETVVDASRKAIPIYYSGAFDPEQDQFTGTWIIKNTVRVFGLISVQRIATGTWMLQRK